MLTRRRHRPRLLPDNAMLREADWVVVATYADMPTARLYSAMLSAAGIGNVLHSDLDPVLNIGEVELRVLRDDALRARHLIVSA
jgi:hypothetical protein